MIPLLIKCIDGTSKTIDMASLQRIAKGESDLHPGWGSTLTFSKELNAFIELSGAPADVRGCAEGAAIEVGDDYVLRVYGKTRNGLTNG